MDYFLQLKKLPHSFDLVIPFLEHEEELLRELQLHHATVYLKTDRVILVSNLKQKPIWAQDHWENCRSLMIDSTSLGAKELKSHKNLSCYFAAEKNELAKKIASSLKTLPLKRINYKPDNPFNFKFTAWTMIENYMIISGKPHQRFPFGWHEFEENKTFPPNRAYLKLWEVLSVYGIVPEKEDAVIELGASPGGWSWVLSEVCKDVYTIDRAALAPNVQKIKNIHHSEGDAFALNPEDYPNTTWLFSDLICTPEKLLETVKFWMAESSVENYVCTIKFKGPCNFDIVKEFLQISNSNVVHLYHNKNEVTWIKTKKPLHLKNQFDPGAKNG